MSWGIDFTTDIFLNHCSFNSIQEVHDKIDELNESINGYKTDLSMYVAANPKEITPTDWQDETIQFLTNKITEIFEFLNEDIILQYKLNLYLDYLVQNNITEIPKIE